MTKISGLPAAADPLPAGSETIVSVPVGGGEYESRSYDMSLTAQYAAAAEAAAASAAALAFGTTPMFKLYSLLLPVEGEDVGQNAGVYGEDISATHTDPVSSLTVSNNGLYSWTGTDWQWVRTLLTNEAIAGGTVTTSKPMISLAQTWNDAGTAFGAINVDITNTASDYSSYFIRGRVGGVDRFRVTRDDTLVFGAESGVGSECLVGFRRVNGRLLGLGAQRDAGGGKLACPVVIGWDTDSGTDLANQTIALISGQGTNRLSIESASAIVNIAENGRFESEVGPSSTDGYIVRIGYEKASANGRTIDYRNFGQSSYAASIVSFTSDTDAVDLVRFDHMAGSTRTTRGKVDALGNATFVTLKVGSNQVVGSRMTGWTAPTGTATRSTFATSTVTLPQLAQALKALIDDLTTHGLIGT